MGKRHSSINKPSIEEMMVISEMENRRRPYAPDIFVGYPMIFFLVIGFPALILSFIKDDFKHYWIDMLIPHILLLGVLTWILFNMRISYQQNKNNFKLNVMYKTLLCINLITGYAVIVTIMPLKFIYNYGEAIFDKASDFDTIGYGLLFLFFYYLASLIQIATVPIVQLIVCRFAGGKLHSNRLIDRLNKVKNDF